MTRKHSSTLERISGDFPKCRAMRHYQKLGFLAAFLFVALVVGAWIGNNEQERVGMAERVISDVVEPSAISPEDPLAEERRNPLPKPIRNSERDIEVGVAMIKLYCGYANYVCQYRNEEDCALATEACVDVRDSYLSSVTSPRRSASISGAVVADTAGDERCNNRAWTMLDDKMWSKSNNPTDYCSCVEGPGCIYSCIDHWTNFVKECSDEYKILKESLEGSGMEAERWEIVNDYPYSRSENPSEEYAPQNIADEFFYFGDVGRWVYPRIWPDAVGDRRYDQCNERRVTCNMYGTDDGWFSDANWVYTNTRPLGVMSDGMNCETGEGKGYCLNGECASCATPEDLSELDEEAQRCLSNAETAINGERIKESCCANIGEEEEMGGVEAILTMIGFVSTFGGNREGLELIRDVSREIAQRKNKKEEVVRCMLKAAEERAKQDLTIDELNQFAIGETEPGDYCIYAIQDENGNRNDIGGIVVNTENGLRCSPLGCPNGMTRAEGYGGRFLCCQGEAGSSLVGSLGTIAVDIPYCPASEASECDRRSQRFCPHQEGSTNAGGGMCCPIDTDCGVERNKGFAICSERCDDPCTGGNFRYRLNIVNLDFSEFRLCCDDEERCERDDGVPKCILNEDKCRDGRFECTSQQSGLSTCCKIGMEYCVSAGENPACYPI